MEIVNTVGIVLAIVSVVALIHHLVKWRRYKKGLGKRIAPKNKNMFYLLAQCRNNIEGTPENMEEATENFDKFGEGLKRTSDTGALACENALNMSIQSEKNAEALEEQHNIQSKASDMFRKTLKSATFLSIKK